MEPRIRCELCGKGQKGPSALREHYSCTHFFQVLLSDGQIAGKNNLQHFFSKKSKNCDNTDFI